ncbi:kinase-like domain-containing protein [Aspergillus californicus]
MPEIIADWEEDGRYFTIAKRIPGKPLSEAWETMSEDQRESVAKETAKFLLELREIHSDKIQMLGGKPVYDGFLFRSSHDAPHGPISSDAELWAELDKALTDVPLSAREKLRKRMPPAEPYTFTHGDLTHVNIMVEDGHVTGIIDWEGSGFFPVWWEFAKAGIGLSDTDAEWKALLRKYMPDHAEAREFWQDLCALSMYPDLNERGVEFLKGVEGQ